MKILEIEIRDVVLTDVKACRILFQSRYLSDIIDLTNHGTGFHHASTYEIPCSTIKDGKEIIIISLIAYDQNDIEQTVGTQIIEVSPTAKNYSVFDEEVHFTMAEDASSMRDAVVSIHYKVTNISIIDTLQRYSDQNGSGFGWNICAIFLPIHHHASSNIDSHDSSLKLRLFNQLNGALLASGKISSKSTSYFIPMIYALSAAQAQDHNPQLAVELEVLNSQNNVIKRFKVKDQGPALYCLRNGDMVAYILIQSLLNKERLSTVVHSVTLYDEARGKYIHGNSKMAHRDQIYALLLLPDEESESAAIDASVHGIIDLSKNISPGKQQDISPKDGYYVFAESKYAATDVPSPRSSNPTSQHVGLFTILATAVKAKLAFRVALIRSQVTQPTANYSIDNPESYIETPGDELIHQIEGDIADYLATSASSQCAIESSLISTGVLLETSRDIHPMSGAITLTLQGQFHPSTSSTRSPGGPNNLITARMLITIAMPISSSMKTLSSLPPAVLTKISSAMPLLPLPSPPKTKTMLESPRPAFADSNLDASPELVTDHHQTAVDPTRISVEQLINSLIERVEERIAMAVDEEAEPLPSDSSFMGASSFDIEPSPNKKLVDAIEGSDQVLQVEDAVEHDRWLALIAKLQGELEDRDRSIAMLRQENSNQAEVRRRHHLL
jgi:hypothetical protein